MSFGTTSFGKSGKAIRFVIGAKIAVLLVLLWATLDDGFYIGDRAATAEEKAKESAPGTAKPEKSDTKDEKKPESAAEPQKTRKSFLSNLLELPSLEPEKVQKEELGRYLEIAERKKRQIEERLEILKKREGQLKGLENSIDEKLKVLDNERRLLAQTLQDEKKLKGERLDKLIAMYAKMEPKKAAPVLEKLDKDLVVELFKAMPQKQVTAILEAMSPDKSVTISEYYGRVRSAREYDILKEMNTELRKEFDECKGLPEPKQKSP